MNWAKVTASAKIESTVDTTAENISETFAVTRSGYHNGAWEEYNLAEKLGDGEIIAYTMKFNEGHGLWMGASENDVWEGEDTYIRPDTAADFVGAPSDMYFQNKFGGTEVIGLASHGGTVGKVTAMNRSPFANKGIEGTYIDATNPNRYDVEYDIMYARVDGVIYMFVKYGTQENYTLVSKSNWTLPETEVTVQLIYSGRGGHKVDITYKNFSLKQNAQEEIRTLVEKNLVGDCIFDGESGTATVNGAGELVSLTGGTLAFEQNGDYIVWDTDTIGDVTNGKFFIEGNFTAWGGNVNGAWKRHQGAGFVLKQMATGKMITIEPSYQTNSELLIQVSEGNGWDTRACLPAKNAPTGENVISFQTEAVASKTNPAKYYMRAEVEGYVWKIWIGKDESTIDFSKPTWEVDMYAHLSTAPGGHGSGSQWSGNSNEIKNREDKFPFIADTSDGKYKAEGSDAWSAGTICMGYVAFGDAGTAGGCIVSNGTINYVSYDDITAIAKSEALAEIEEYAQSLNFTLTDVEKAPVTGMKSYKDKAKAIEEAKALIYFTDYKADAFVTVSAYAQEQGVTLSEEESAYVNGLIENATTKDEIDAGVGKAISLIDAEKVTDGSILGIAVKVDEAKEYVADTIASTKEKGITDYAKTMLDNFEDMAMEYLDALYNLETIEQDIAQGKKLTDDMCAAVQMKFTVTILDDKGEAVEEIRDVLFGTEVASLLEGKVASAKEDDKGGLGEYVFDKWSYETEDGVVGSNLEITPEYKYNFYNTTISGEVWDYAHNHLAGVEVSITDENGTVYTGVTDENGTYTIDAKVGNLTITWSTPEITDSASRYADVNKAYVVTRTKNVTIGGEFKDALLLVDVALAYGLSTNMTSGVTVSGTYTGDLDDATIEGLSYDLNGYMLNPAFRTGAVLKENTFYKFTVNFHDDSDGNPAHNIHNSGKYTNAKNEFADIGLKMVVGKKAIKVNGPSANVVACDQWCQDYVNDAANANATTQFSITGKNPFLGLFENSFRGAGDVSRVLADYEKSDMDIMYVKTTDNHVDVYGKLTNYDSGWVKIGDGTVAGDWITFTMGTRSGEFAHNWTVEGIEYGAIDTETGLPAGAEVDAYNFTATNASAAWNSETNGYEYELNLSGIGNLASDVGGDNSTAYIYDNTKTYAFGTGKMVVEGDFRVVQGRAGGAAFGITLRDSKDNARKLNVLMRSNGKQVVFGLNDGNCDGARTWNGLDKLNSNANSTVYDTSMVKEWHSANEQNIHLKYVFDNNTLTVYYDGIKFFSVENLTEFIKTALDSDAVNQYNTKYPTSSVYVGMYFNHENGFGTDRAVVNNFSVTYESNEEILATEKAEAKKVITDAATEYGAEANAEVLAQIDAVTERGQAALIAEAEVAKMKYAYDLANEKKTALDALNAYATEIGVAGEIPAGITSLITGVTELGKAQDALVEAKGLLTVYAKSPDCWEIIVASTKTLDEKYAAVDQSALTAKGIEDLNSAYATAKSTIHAIEDASSAQATANGAIAAFEEVAAKVQGTVAVTFGSNDAIDVKYGTVLSAIDASALTATKAEDNYYTYEFKGWKVNDDAVVSDIAVEAEFTAINKVVAVSGKAVDERGTALAGVTVSAVIDVDGKEATASTTTAEDGTYTFNVPVGDKTDITLAKPFYFSKATSYEGIKSEAQAIANAVMPWTWANENSKNANANVLNIKGEAPTTALDSTVDTATLEYNYVGTRDLMSRLETNLAVGEAIQFSFKWNDGQEADQDPFMRMMYGNAAYHINSYGTGFGGMTESGVTDAHRTFDIALGRDLMYGAFTGKVYDFAFVREGTTIAMYGKHGGAAQWKYIAYAEIAADNTDTTFKFGFGTKYSVVYNYSIFGASKVAPDVIKNNTGAVITGGHGSVDKNADGSWSLWGSLSNIGTAISSCKLTTSAFDQTKYDMTGKRVVIDTDFSMGSGERNDNVGLYFTSSDGGVMMLGFFRNGLAMQMSGENRWGQRNWSLTSASTGVLYWNDSAMFKLGDLNKNGNYRQASAHLTYEIQDRVLAMYVDGTLAFACDYVQVMGNHTNAENANANTVEKAEAKAPKYTNVQFGFFGNHERTGHALDYAAENFKVTLVDPAAENALADAKAKTIAKINAIVANVLSPAGKEYYEANKASVIAEIEAYTAVEGDNLTKSIVAIEKLAAPVLVTNRDYTVHITGYGKVKAKWGTTLASLVEDKVAKTSSNACAAYYNTDGKWNITEGAKVTIDNTVINPTGNVVSNGGDVGISNNNGGYFYGISSNSSGYAIAIPNEMCDVNKGTMTITATVKYWGTTASKYPEAIGFGLTQVSTGKTIRINNNRDAGVWMSTDAGVGGDLNGYGVRIFPSHSGLPNWSATAKSATTRDTAGTLNVKLEVNGATWKFWASTGSFSANPNVTVNAQEFYYNTAQTATGGASASAKTTGCDNLPNLATDGIVVPNVVVFGDGSCAWEIQNVNVDYSAN